MRGGRLGTSAFGSSCFIFVLFGPVSCRPGRVEVVHDGCTSPRDWVSGYIVDCDAKQCQYNRKAWEINRGRYTNEGCG